MPPRGSAPILPTVHADRSGLLARPTDSYWEQTLYSDPRTRPVTAAPLRGLPPRAALRFRRARDGLHALKGVTEQVVFMGPPWKWVWMFEVGGRKVAYLHPMRRGVSATFVVTGLEVPHFVGAELPDDAAAAYRDGVTSSGVRLCWMDLPNLSSVDALLAAVAFKHRLLATGG